MAMELTRAEGQENTTLSIIEGLSLNRVQQSITAIQEWQTMAKQNLVAGHDYGESYRGSGKPCLLKPGAEKILMLLGLSSEYEIIERIQDYEKGFFAYTIRCILKKNGQIITQGLGHCNSQEKKYTSDKQDVYMLGNTCLKMAKKRAQVDATLTVGSLSDIFTQDLEDMAQFEHREIVENMTLERAKGVKINFGTHKGRTIGEIAAENMGYVEWLAKNAYDDVVKKAADMILNGEQTKQEKSKAQKPKQDKKEAPKEQVAFDFDDSELPF